MILRKPYAFLIKNFKLIHIILFFICTILLFRLRSVYVFFDSIVTTDAYTYLEDMASHYVPISSIILAFVMGISAFIIYKLMKSKDKPVLYYLFFIIYSVALIILFFVFRNFFNSLDDTLFDNLTKSVYRDTSLIVYLISYFFVVLTFIRGFGFDIKKFSFDRDKKELEIEDTDSEEVEVSFEIDKDSITQFVRRNKREMLYYLKDNISTLLIVFGVVLIIAGFSLYNNVIKDNLYYKENTIFKAENFSIRVNKSYFTNKSYNGVVLDKYYVISNISVISNGSYPLNTSYLKLEHNNKSYRVVHNADEYFRDLGNPYNNQKINNQKEYILIFEVDENSIKGNYFLDFFNKSNEKKDEVKVEYSRVKLEFDEEKDDIKNYKNGVDVKINNFIVEGNILIKEHEFNNKYLLNIKSGDKDLLKPINSTNDNIILKIDYKTDINMELLKNYITIEYNINDKTKIIPNSKLEVEYCDIDAMYLRINKEVKDASNLKLRLNIRNDIYIIDL